MALVTPDVGEVSLLTEFLGNGEDWILHLYSNDVTPNEDTVLGDLTEANYAGYSAPTLTRSVSGSTWETPTTTANVTSSRYNPSTPQSFQSSSGTQQVFGWYATGATSGNLLMVERFATAPETIDDTTPLLITPRKELD